MSRTTTALLVKLIMTTVFAWLAFGRFPGNSTFWIGAVGVLGTIMNYVLGDLFVLPAFGNTVASLGDGGLAALTAFLLAVISPAFDVTFGSLLLFGVLIAVGEYFFHGYLRQSEKVAP